MTNAKFVIWKFKPGKNEEVNKDAEAVGGKIFMKMAHFFTAEQVEPIKKEAVL